MSSFWVILLSLHNTMHLVMLARTRCSFVTRLLTPFPCVRILKRCPCHQRSHAWRCAELYHLPWKQTCLLDPRLQLKQGMDLSLARAQSQVQRVDGPRPFPCRCPIAEHLDDHQVTPMDQQGSDPTNEGGGLSWGLEM